MSIHDNDGRSPVAVAMQMVSQITTVAFMMVLPALLGYWLDRRWGTSPWLVIIGSILGFVLGFLQLLQISERANKQDKNKH